MTWLYAVDLGNLNVENSMEFLQKTKNKTQQSHCWAYIQCGVCGVCVCGVYVWCLCVCGVCVCVVCMCGVCVCVVCDWSVQSWAVRGSVLPLWTLTEPHEIAKIKKTGFWEGGSGWGTHVNPWLIRVKVWQKPLQCCKVITLQLIKINGEKKKKRKQVSILKEFRRELQVSYPRVYRLQHNCDDGDAGGDHKYHSRHLPLTTCSVMSSGPCDPHDLPQRALRGPVCIVLCRLSCRRGPSGRVHVATSRSAGPKASPASRSALTVQILNMTTGERQNKVRDGADLECVLGTMKCYEPRVQGSWLVLKSFFQK